MRRIRDLHIRSPLCWLYGHQMNTKAFPCAARFIEGAAKARNADNHQGTMQANERRAPARQPEWAGQNPESSRSARRPKEVPVRELPAGNMRNKLLSLPQPYRENNDDGSRERKKRSYAPKQDMIEPG